MEEYRRQTKGQYFRKLHERLAREYKVEEAYISSIRSLAISEGMDRLEIMDYFDEKGKTTNSQHKKEAYREIFSFLEELSDLDFSIIVKRTEYDS